MIWSEMLDAISGCGRNTEITVYWKDGLILKGFSEGIDETCTCELEDENEWVDYYMCVMKITHIVKLPFGSDDLEKYQDIKVRGLFEVSEMNEPIKIEAKGKGIIWQKQH